MNYGKTPHHQSNNKHLNIHYKVHNIMQFRLLPGPHKKRQSQKLMKSLEPWWTVRHDCSFHKIMSLPTISFIFHLNPTHLQMLIKLKLKVIFQHFNVRLIRLLTEMHAHMLAHPPGEENCMWKTYLCFYFPLTQSCSILQRIMKSSFLLTSTQWYI